MLNKKKIIWFLTGVFVYFFIAYFPLGLDLTHSAKLTMALLCLCIIYFIFEPIPLVAVAFLIGIIQVLTGLTSYHEVPKTYMHDAIFFIMGALMVATVLIKYRYHEKIALIVIKLAGSNISKIVFVLVSSCAIASSFISEHAVASIMLPVGIGFVALSGGIKKCPNLAKLLMFSISVGCMIGAIATPSGGMRNVLMISYFQQFKNIQISYGEWMLYVYPCTLFLIPLVSWLLPKVFKPEMTDLSEAASQLKNQIKAREKGILKERVVGFFFIGVILLWIFGSAVWGLGTVAIMGATFFMMVGLMEWEDYEKRVHWNVVFLYGGIVSLGALLDKTGAAQWLAGCVLTVFSEIGIHSGIGLTSASSIITMLLANTMGSGPAIAVMGPVVIKMAEKAGDSVLPMGLAAAIASSFSFFLVVGSPVNIIIYGSGFLRPRDFLKMGWLMSLVCIGVVVVVMVAFYWPLLGL